MMRRVLWACLACACSSGVEEAELGSWQLVWSDEFDGAAGSPPNPEFWVHDVGGDGWGNNQLEFNTDRTDNVFLDGEGRLVIRAQREDYQGNTWTSGRIKTQDTVAFAEGRVEARIKLPYGPGLWPAFWMLGEDIPEVGWPLCGEIDIMEVRGGNPNEMIGTVHGPGYSGGESVGDTYRFPSANAEYWHVYRVEIDEGYIAWFVDDVLYHRVTAADLPDGALWVFDHPFFLLLNQAVGGTFLQPPNEQTQDVNDMLVDWVRVSQRVR